MKLSENFKIRQSLSKLIKLRSQVIFEKFLRNRCHQQFLEYTVSNPVLLPKRLRIQSSHCTKK